MWLHIHRLINEAQQSHIRMHINSVHRADGNKETKHNSHTSHSQMDRFKYYSGRTIIYMLKLKAIIIHEAQQSHSAHTVYIMLTEIKQQSTMVTHHTQINRLKYYSSGRLHTHWLKQINSQSTTVTHTHTQCTSCWRK